MRGAWSKRPARMVHRGGLRQSKALRVEKKPGLFAGARAHAKMRRILRPAPSPRSRNEASP